MARAAGQKLIADNRRARHDYHLSDRIEVGIELTGTEVKSLRDGRVVLQRRSATCVGGRSTWWGPISPSTPRGTGQPRSRPRPEAAPPQARDLSRLGKVSASVGSRSSRRGSTGGRARQGRARARARQGGAGQEARHRRPRRPPADGARAQGPPLGLEHASVPRGSRLRGRGSRPPDQSATSPCVSSSSPRRAARRRGRARERAPHRGREATWRCEGVPARVHSRIAKATSTAPRICA